MPAFRNVQCRRSSGRIWNKAPIAYDEHGWETDPATLVFSRSQMISSPHSTATSPSTASVDSDFEAPGPVRKNKGKGKGKATHPDHVPRPKNAFIFFRSYFYQTLGGRDQNQISVAAGKAWKALPLEEKAPFQALAEEEKRLHQINYPHYTYAPGSKGSAPKRKAAPKKKTPPSVKKMLVSQLKRRASRRISISHIPIPRRDPTPPSQIAIPTLLSPLAVEVIQPVIDLTYEAPQVSEDIFNPAWSFVPTSEIPPLELSPPKAEKMSYDLSLRPSSYDYIDQPFQSYAAAIPATVESFFAGSQQEELNYDYVDLPIYDFHLAQCNPLDELWTMDASAVTPEASYDIDCMNSIPTDYIYDNYSDVSAAAQAMRNDVESFYAPAPVSAFPSPGMSELEMEQWLNY